MKTIKIYAIPFLIGMVIILAIMVNRTNREKKRFEANQNSLLSELKTYQTKDSLNAAQVGKLTLTAAEFRRSNEEMAKTVESLNLKIKRLQSATEIVTHTEYKIKTEVKDSLVFIAGKTDTIKCIKYIDKWLNLDGCIRDNKFTGIIQTTDTLDHFVNRVPRKFLFFRYGTKAIKMDVVSKNPHSKIVYARYIELK